MRPQSLPAVYAEKRALARARQSRPARCVFNDGATVLEVAVRNISPLGARISGPGIAGLPETFELRIPDGFGGHSARQARLVWIRNAAAGLRFVDE
jgi:PilZ domain